MADTSKLTGAFAGLALAMALPLGLAACGDAEEPAAETDYEVGATDQSGGELIVADPDAPQIEDVTIPETPMTSVPPGEETPAAEPSPAATRE